MKNLNLTTLLVIMTLIFTSCTQEDNLLLEEPTTEDLLKSFELDVSAKGDFSLGYQLGKGLASDNILDTKANINNINLYLTEGQTQSKQSQELYAQDGELNIVFNNNDQRIKSITILDDEFIKTKSADENELLASYGIAGNGDGTYDLEFVVEDGVSVDYIYDGDRDVYEIHLTEDDNATQADFIQTFTKEEGVALKIEFVNSVDKAAKSTNSHNRPSIVVA